MLKTVDSHIQPPLPRESVELVGDLWRNFLYLRLTLRPRIVDGWRRKYPRGEEAAGDVKRPVDSVGNPTHFLFCGAKYQTLRSISERAPTKNS